MRPIDADKIISLFKAVCERCGKDKQYDGVMCRACEFEDVIDIVENAPTLDVVQIPEGATNGDMLKALFPYIREEDKCQMYYSVNLENLSRDRAFNEVGIKKDWWDAPYRKD